MCGSETHKIREIPACPALTIQNLEENMSCNERQLLREADIEPSGGVIARALGEANGLYVKFLEAVKTRGIDVDWRYYKDGGAWLGKGLYKWTTARGTKKETTAFWLSVWEGFFKVTIYVPEKARADALALSLGGETQKMVEDAKQIGKLKFFPLTFDLRSDGIFEDIYRLVDFRKLIK